MHPTSEKIRERYHYLGRTGIYDSLVATLLLGQDQSIRRNVFRRVLNEGSSTDRVLDAGTGTGRSISVLSELLPDADLIRGIDIAEGMLSAAKKRTRHISGVTLERRDLRDIVLERFSNFYDLVTASYVFSVVNEPREVARKLSKVCQPGGMIVILDAQMPSADAAILNKIVRFEEKVACADVSRKIESYFSNIESIRKIDEIEQFEYLHAWVYRKSNYTK